MDGSRHEIAVCSFCGNAASEVLYGQGETAIVRCTRCGLAYASPRLREQFMLDIYRESSYFHDKSQVTDDFLNRRRTLHDVMFEVILNRIGAPPPQGRLLDLGCGAGTFLQHAQRAGWQVEGWEVSPYAAQFAREHLGLSVRTGPMDLDQVAAESFEVVTMFDVIEHVYDPKQTLRNVYRVLKPRGRIVLTTPNFAGVTFRLFGRRHYGLDTSERGLGHVTFFTRVTLEAFLESAGFDPTVSWVGEIYLKNLSNCLRPSISPRRTSTEIHSKTRRLLRPAWWTVALYHTANWVLAVTRLGDQITALASKK
jgi:2-polyprenyl-3-methyl-5-hydroxy-6-metoxy-1,4-benzoquinol methylase